jgi:hypothetical protein
MQPWATVVTAQTSFGMGTALGANNEFARSDHAHGTPAAPFVPSAAASVTNESVGVAAVVGTATVYARQDHVHGWAASVANLDMGAFKVVNLADPTGSTDGATKNYVDNAITGMAWKNPVRLTPGPSTNFGVLSGLLPMDGVTPVDGDRILLSGQSTASSNGIYVVHSGAWVRATDNDSGAEMLNATVYVEEGTTYADTGWVCTTNAPIVIGTTALTFVQFSGSGSVTAGAGMTQAGNTLNVITGDTSLVVNADELHVNTAVIATVASLAGYAPTSRLINTTAPLTGGGNLTADRTLAISNFTTGAAGAVPSSPGGTTTFLRADGTWASPPGTGISKFAAALAGTASPEVVTHNLNTRDVQVTVLNGATPYTAVEVDWDATTVNTVTIRYNPNLGAGYRAVVVG